MCGQRLGQRRVDLDGDDALDDVQQAEGERAEARPDLDDDVVGPDSAVRTMRRTVLASMTKFWPRCLVGRRSSAWASARTSLPPNSPSSLTGPLCQTGPRLPRGTLCVTQAGFLARKPA